MRRRGRGRRGRAASREPWQSAVLQIFEGIGEQLQAFGVPGPAQFDCAFPGVRVFAGPGYDLDRGGCAPPDTRPPGSQPATYGDGCGVQLR